ncbi:MAG: rod shape-determining protein MreD [Actinomycetota bacterium]
MRRWVLFSAASFVAILLSRELTLSLPILGIGPDLLIVTLVAFSIGERPRSAAIAGFAVGLARDLLLTTPAGLSAFAYAITGYGVALVGVPRGVGPVVGLFAGATFASQLVYGLGAVFLGPQVDPSPLPRMLLVSTAYNALISPLLMPLVSRVVRPEARAQVGE